jgi:uncharacterized protein (TIGR02145 family)
MKDVGTIETGNGLWSSPNLGATNSSGFKGIPGGMRYWNGLFLSIGKLGTFWSSSITESTKAYYWSLSYSKKQTLKNSSFWIYGYSSRCIKDE